MATKKGIDLSVFKPKDTYTFNLRHPSTDERLDIAITVFSSDSKKYRAVVHKLRNDRMGKRSSKVSSEQIEKNAMDILVACTESWRNMMFDGKDLECTPENVRMIYTELPWVYDQVDTHIGDRTNFLS